MSSWDGGVVATVREEPGFPNFGGSPPAFYSVLEHRPFVPLGAAIVESSPSYSSEDIPGKLVDFGGWFMNQIHYKPQSLAFGNIIGDKEIDITVVNTWRFEERTLNAVDLTGLQPGISIVANAPIFTLGLFGTRVMTFKAASVGASEFDDFALFEWDNRTSAIASSGRRLILMYFQPEQPIQEQLKWMTGVMKSRSGLEQRHALRSAPRQQFKYKFVQDDELEASRLRTMLLALQAFQFGVPVWQEAQRLEAAYTAGDSVITVNTVGIDHRVGGTLMFFLPDGTYFDSVTGSFTATTLTLSQVLPQSIPIGTYLIPVRFGHIVEGPQFSNAAVNQMVTTMTFETTDNIDLSGVSGFPTHPTDGKVVLSDPNMISGTENGNWTFELGRIDNGTGLAVQIPLENFGDINMAKGTMIFNDLAEIRRWRALFHALRGGWGSFYLPTFRKDLEVAVTFQLNQTTFKVVTTDWALFVGASAPQRDLMLELANGTQYFARVTSVVDNGDGTDTVTLSAAFDALDSAVVPLTAKLCFLRLVRIDGDVVSFDHAFIGTAAVRFSVVAIQS